MHVVHENAGYYWDENILNMRLVGRSASSRLAIRCGSCSYSSQFVFSLDRVSASDRVSKVVDG
jgi:hypothetical protein